MAAGQQGTCRGGKEAGLEADWRQVWQDVGLAGRGIPAGTVGKGQGEGRRAEFGV